MFTEKIISRVFCNYKDLNLKTDYEVCDLETINLFTYLFVFLKFMYFGGESVHRWGREIDRERQKLGIDEVK